MMMMMMNNKNKATTAVVVAFAAILAASAVVNVDAQTIPTPPPVPPCDMCRNSAPAGNMVPARADLVIPFLAIAENDNPTCAEVQAFGMESVTLNDPVCKVITDHSNFCGCPGMPGTPVDNCFLCPDKSEPGAPLLATPYEDTCDELNTYLRFLPLEDCLSQRVQAMQRSDAFCQCSGVVADCYMCPGGNNDMLNPSNLVPFYEFLANSFSTTCQDLADFYTLYDTEDPEISTCEFVQLEAQYCGCMSIQPIVAPKAMGVCKDGQIPANQLRMIDEIGMTCAELELYLQFQPADQVDMPWNLDLQRFDFYCGCPDATAPCPICPDGSTSVSKPDAVIPYLIIPNNENPTCKELATLGVIADPGELVLEDCSIFEAQSDFCGCPNAAPPVNACQFCPGGISPPNPDQVTPFGDTCAELAEYLSYLPADECASERVGFIQRQDFLCGCEGASTNCALCGAAGNNDIVNPERRVPLLSLPLNTNPTCQEVVEFMAVNDGDLSDAGCSALQSYAGYCGCGAAPPVNACTFCPNGGSPANFDKVVSELFSCEELFEFVSYLPGEDCAADAADFEQIRAFSYTCGCPGTTPACTLCPNDAVPTNFANELTSDGETTCSEFAELVRSLTADQCIEQSDLITSTASACGCGANPAAEDFTQPQCAIQQNPELCTDELLDSVPAACECYAFCGDTFVECQSIQGGLLRTDQCASTPITGCNRAISRDSVPSEQNGDNGGGSDKNTTVIAVAIAVPAALALLVAVYFFATRKSKAEQDKMDALHTDPDTSGLPVAGMEGSLSIADVGATGAVQPMSPSSMNGASIMTETIEVDGEGPPKVV
mmetsp:Transcript_26585/g.63366  ORF Transcript_26585/g.63366 Transcript_26585/m.63366 type:complete len:831 (+) Transcript_26585:393-2885(+)